MCSACEYNTIKIERLVSSASSTTTSYRKAIIEDMEAAVIDAHDLSDPGIEAASMERAVVMAADLADEQMKKHDEHNKNVSSYFN